MYIKLNGYLHNWGFSIFTPDGKIVCASSHTWMKQDTATYAAKGVAANLGIEFREETR